MRAPFASQPVASLVFVLAAGMLAGCGSTSSSSNGVASKTPLEIVAAARAAGAGAATVHVDGSILGAGKPISLDMELVADKGGEGRLTLGGLDLDLIDVDRAIYIKGNAAFYRRFVGGESAKLLQGRWLKGRAGRGALASFASLTDLGKLIDTALAGHGELERAPVTMLDGHEVVGASDPAEGGTLYVSTTGTPYPVEITEIPGKIVFDRWNRPVSLAPPANAININQLQGSR